MEERLALICGRYGLGEPLRAERLRRGTASAGVWRPTARRGDFVVRALSGPQQGEREWAAHRHLREKGFACTPDILTEAGGGAMTELAGAWYQVQRAVPGEMPDPARPGTAAALAGTVWRLDRALADCPASAAGPAPAPAELWAAARPGWEALGLPLTMEAARRAAERAACREGERQVIHGDLGPWNTLRAADGPVWVIDFGAARLGDPYFDLAAMLGGIINHSEERARAGAAAEFLAQCRRQDPDFDPARLAGQLERWALEGLAGCAGGSVPPGMAGNFLRALDAARQGLANFPAGGYNAG